MTQELILVNDVDAANDDSGTTSDEQGFVGLDPNSDDEDKGAGPELEGDGNVAGKGDLGICVNRS